MLCKAVIRIHDILHPVRGKHTLQKQAQETCFKASSPQITDLHTKGQKQRNSRKSTGAALSVTMTCTLMGLLYSSEKCSGKIHTLDLL